MSALLYSVTIEGNPGDAAINRARRISRTGGYKSARLKSFERRAAAAIERDQPLTQPVVGVRVHAYWPRIRHLEGCKELAYGDADAPIKATLDALERAGVLDDDARVVELIARKSYDKHRPRIVVEIYAVDTERVGG